MQNLFLQFISRAHAQTPPNWRNITLPTANSGFGGDIETMILFTARWLFGFVGVFAVISLVYSGVIYLTSGADSTKTEKAKNNIGYAITGIIIAASAFLIVTLIINAINSA